MKKYEIAILATSFVMAIIGAVLIYLFVPNQKQLTATPEQSTPFTKLLSQEKATVEETLKDSEGRTVFIVSTENEKIVFYETPKDAEGGLYLTETKITLLKSAAVMSILPAFVTVTIVSLKRKKKTEHENN